MPTPSPHHRPVSVSPAGGMHGVPGLQRQPSDYFLQSAINNGMNNGLNNTMNIPPHMRSEIATHSSRPASPANSHYSMPSNGSGQRQHMTSHPTAYPLPSTLEPPATNPPSQNGSVGGSPHIAGSGWQSPAHQTHPGAQQTDYSYPDPNTQQYVQNAGNLYYNQQAMRRPQSTDPIEAYQAQRMPQELWTQHHQ